MPGFDKMSIEEKAKECDWYKSGICIYKGPRGDLGVRKCYMLNGEYCDNFEAGKVKHGIDTKKESYNEVKGSDMENNQEKQVLAYIAAHPDSCIREISEGTGIQKSSICGRMDTLKEKKLIYLTGIKLYGSPTQKSVESWRIQDGTSSSV